VYVASKYPDWKIKVLQILQKKFEEGTLPLVDKTELKSNKKAEGQWNQIIKEFAQDPELKKFGKHLGPFASFKREEAASSGVSALSTENPFDELALISEHIPFLVDRLKLEKGALSVLSCDNVSVEHADKVKEAQPLKPVVVFEMQPCGTTKVDVKSGGVKNSAANSATITDLKKLDEHLNSRSYFEGGAVATDADFAQLKVTPNANADQYPHVSRWSKHITFLNQRKQQF